MTDIYVSGKKTIKKLEKKLTSVLESDTPMNVHHIQVIQMILGCQATETASHDQGSRRNLHRFCVQALAKVVKDKENRRLVVAKEILGVLDTFSKVCNSSTIYQKSYIYMFFHIYTHVYSLEIFLVSV